MTKVQICWTSGVTEAEMSAVRTAVNDVLNHVSPDFSVEVAAEACEADSWVASCRTQNERGYGPQIDATCVLTNQIPATLAKYQISRLTVVLTEADITASGNKFLFGAEQPVGPLKVGAILSVARLLESAMAEQVLRRLARHEFGHALGLIPESRSTNVATEVGLHCTNVCTMRQGMCLAEFEDLTQEEERANVDFCGECLDYLKTGVRSLKVIFGDWP